MSSSSSITQLNECLYQKDNEFNDNDCYMDRLLSSLSLSFKPLIVSVDMLMLQTKRVFLGRASCHYNNTIDSEGYGIKALRDIRHRLYRRCFTANDQIIDSSSNNVLEIYSAAGQLKSERIFTIDGGSSNRTTTSSIGTIGDSSSSSIVLFGECDVSSLPNPFSAYFTQGYICRLFYIINNSNDSIITCTSLLLTIALLPINDNNINNESTTTKYTYTMINNWNLLQLIILHVNYVYDICHYHHQRLQLSTLCLNNFLFYSKFIQIFLQHNDHHEYYNYTTKKMITIVLESILPLLTQNDNEHHHHYHVIDTLLNYMINY